MKHVVCLTTAASLQSGKKIANHLVKNHYAACVNIVPGLTSVYHWKKKLCREPEVLLIIKTRASRVTSVEKELKKIHPYELPEFIVLPIVRGSRNYLNWIASC